MTAEVAVLNKSAVALAADSKATVRIKGVLKSHDTANKLFTLSKYHPVGVMINGNAEFMQIPWETLVKLYRDKLRDKCLSALFEYAEDVIFSLTSDYDFPAARQNENVAFIILDFLYEIQSRVRELQDRGIEREEARSRAIDSQRRRDLALDDLSSMAGITPQTIRDLYSEQITDAISYFFEDIDEEKKEKLIDYISKVVLKKKFSDGCSEIIIAGFGDKEIFPSLKSYTTDGVVAGKLRYTISSEKKIGTVALSREHITASFESRSQRVQAFIRGECWDLVDKKYTKVFVWPADGDPTRILGFYSLSAFLVQRGDLNNRYQRRAPGGIPVPMALIGYMGKAPDVAKGFGATLINDAARRVSRIADLAVWGLCLHAENESLAAWYSRLGFAATRTDAKFLYGPLSAFIDCD